MTDKDISESGEKAKALLTIKEDNLLQKQINSLKSLLLENGLENGIIRIQIFAENKDKKEEMISSIEFTDKGSMLYYHESF